MVSKIRDLQGSSECDINHTKASFVIRCFPEYEWRLSVSDIPQELRSYLAAIVMDWPAGVLSLTTIPTDKENIRELLEICWNLKFRSEQLMWILLEERTGSPTVHAAL